MNIENIIDSNEEIIARIFAYTDDTGKLCSFSVTRGKFYDERAENSINQFVKLYKEVLAKKINVMAIATIKIDEIESIVGPTN